MVYGEVILVHGPMAILAADATILQSNAARCWPFVRRDTVGDACAAFDMAPRHRDVLAGTIRVL